MSMHRYHDQKTLHEVIRTCWSRGLDTWAMARLLELPEHTIERELHAAQEAVRSAGSTVVCGND